ncbi:hypothetical protein Tco_0331467 [Tanacetum coccineum]
MDTQASSSHGFKKIKLIIIPPKQLLFDLTSDNENLSTPSPTTTSSSPTPPNAPSKTTSTKETTSSHENTSSSFQSKLQVSPPPTNEPTSPQPHNIFLENLMDIVRVICEEFVDLKLAIRQDLGFIPSGNVVLSSTYVGKILGADQLLVILCYRYQESGIGYWILSMTISGSGVSILRLGKVARERDC